MKAPVTMEGIDGPVLINWSRVDAVELLEATSKEGYLGYRLGIVTAGKRYQSKKTFTTENAVKVIKHLNGFVRRTARIHGVVDLDAFLSDPRDITEDAAAE